MILIISSLESFVQLIAVLLIFVFVLAITYLTTRWIAGTQRARSNNKNLYLLETIGVGNNKFISIVKAGEKFLVVSINKDDVKLLAQLDKDELIDYSLDDTNTKTDSFEQLLNKLKDKIPQK